MKRLVYARSAMWPSFRQTAQEYYSAATDYIESGEYEYNLNEVEASARALLRLAGGMVKPSCYGFAACVAAILDDAGIPYTCYVGFACPASRGYSQDLIDKMPSNHVWIESNGSIFDMFPGSSDLVYGTPQETITFRKKETK